MPLAAPGTHSRLATSSFPNTSRRRSTSVTTSKLPPSKVLHFGGISVLPDPLVFRRKYPTSNNFRSVAPNSIRAWVQRGLGPGGFVDSLAYNVNNRFRLDRDNRLRLYQQGDLKMEFNFEYRFNLYWRLDAALFLDAGNTWTVTRDSSRCGLTVPLPVQNHSRM